MNLPIDLTAPAVVLLVKWTGLLALAWGAHGLLRRGDPRWRLMLWRSVLGFSLLLPLLQPLNLPGLRIPVHTNPSALDQSSNPIAAPAAMGEAPNAHLGPASAKATTPLRGLAPATPVGLQRAPIFPVVTGQERVVALWLLGCVFGAVRLTWLQLALASLRNRAARPTAEIEQVAAQVRAALKLRQKIQVRISDAIASPFVCDLFRPTILLPQNLVASLTPAELRAVLNHEMAHIRQRDLAWCVGWQWLRVFGWFHPLVWAVPAAHNLACEQEADRVASTQMPERASYVQLLARLALKVLALPALETRLTVNGGSQIAKRLYWLGQGRPARWNWRYSAYAFSLSLLLFLAVVGCGPAKDNPANAANPAKAEFKKVLVVVQDDEGKAIAGATITSEGFRVKGIHHPDANTWRKDWFGPPEKVITDSDGKAYLKYPVVGIPEEKEYTSSLFFTVAHPDYATARPEDYSVDTPEPPVRLTRGIHLTVSGYIGSDHRPVPELAPILNEKEIHAEDWQETTRNAYSFNKMSPGGHLLQLMGRLPSGQIVYSDVREFTAEKGKDYNFDIEMKPGIRLEGRLDDKVPRPVTNGRVIIGIRPEEFPAWTNWNDVDPVFKKFPNVSFWRSYRPIAPDGTFVFESVPPGGLDVIVHGDGFASKDGGQFARGFGVPQTFPLQVPTTKIEIATEPTATLKFTAKTKDGQPIAGASIYIYPNVLRIGGIFGDMRKSSEEPFNKLAPLPDVPFSTKTSEDGVAVIRNVPICSRGLDVEHPQFQVPLQEPKGIRDRYVRLSYKPGETNRLTLVLEPKGTDFIGTAR